MTLSPEKRIERSVDSLQKIYTVVIALAIGHAIQTLLINRGTTTFANGAEVLGRIPSFFALVAVLVPFYHGMNRHLDVCYLERFEGLRAEMALLFDFIIFFLEACLLFAVAYSIGPDLRPFVYLGILLGFDAVWALVSHWIHYSGTSPSGVLRWAAVNGISIALGLFVALVNIYSPVAKTWLLLVIAIGRFVADYKYCWQFYFPRERSRAPVAAFTQQQP